MNSFVRKVEAERSILTEVNIYTKGKGQLTGLSSSAIDNWCSFHNVELNGEVSNTLRNLSDLCNSLSDRSNESFVNIPIERIYKIKKEVLILIDGLTAHFHKNA
ncbi:MAG: hypothetical protein Ctma_1001 [Catillopecten margaritatus gill symbiont]|uniref:Uncharacterized protein n=1 Tax=Catillopecten margaritatus gill symbiont TaxID=3083288 RepID=A0AAU6PH02_9GAMM